MVLRFYSSQAGMADHTYTAPTMTYLRSISTVCDTILLMNVVAILKHREGYWVNIFKHHTTHRAHELSQGVSHLPGLVGTPRTPDPEKARIHKKGGYCFNTLDSRPDLVGTPGTYGAGSKTQLRSRCCAILKKVNCQSRDQNKKRAPVINPTLKGSYEIQD